MQGRSHILRECPHIHHNLLGIAGVKCVEWLNNYRTSHSAGKYFQWVGFSSLDENIPIAATEIKTAVTIHPPSTPSSLMSFLQDESYITRKSIEHATETGCFLAVFQLYCEQKDVAFVKPSDDDKSLFTELGFDWNDSLVSGLHVTKTHLPKNYELELHLAGKHQRLLINGIRAPDKFEAVQKFCAMSKPEQDEYVRTKLQDIAVRWAVNALEDIKEPLCCAVCLRLFACPCQTNTAYQDACLKVTKHWDLKERIFGTQHTLHVCSDRCQDIAMLIERAYQTNIKYQILGGLSEKDVEMIKSVIKAQHIAKLEGVEWLFLTSAGKTAYRESCQNRSDWNDYKLETVNLDRIGQYRSDWDLCCISYTFMAQFPPVLVAKTDGILDLLSDIRPEIDLDTLVPFLRKSNLVFDKTNPNSKTFPNLLISLLNLHGWHRDFVAYVQELDLLSSGDVMALIMRWKETQIKDLEDLFSPISFCLEHGLPWKDLINVFNPISVDKQKRNILHIAAKKSLPLFVEVCQTLSVAQCCMLMKQHDTNQMLAIDYLPTTMFME